MGESGLNEPSSSPKCKNYTEIIEEVFPTYLAMGMTYDQFWLDDVSLVKAYRRADDLRRKHENTMLWLQGIYVAEALQSTVGNMFTKGSKHKYPEEPFAISAAEQEERREREQRARMERIKAAFTAKALRMNAKTGGQNNDT